MQDATTTTDLRSLLEARRGVLVPGVANALAARVVDDLGFEACYLTGAGLTNTVLGLPDLAFVGLQDLVQAVDAIRGVTALPLVVDADTGFGNAANVYHTTRRLSRAGADAMQIEDQVSPKKCGHFAGKQIVPIEEMLARIHASVDARIDDSFLVVARTDARAVEGFEAAVERAGRYAEAGADVTFVEAPESVQEIRALCSSLAVPQVINMVVGGRTPVVPQRELAAMGFGMVLYANVALQAALLGMQRALGELKAQGAIDEASGLLASFAERQRIVATDDYDALTRRYES